MLAPPPPFRSFYQRAATPPRVVGFHALGVAEWMPPGIVDRPQGTADWLFMAFHDAVTIRLDGVEHEVAAPSLMVWSPGRGHWYGRRASRWCHSWMHAIGPLVARLVDEAGVPVDRPLPGVPRHVLDDGVAALHDEVERHARPDAVIIECRLRALMHAIARAAGSGPVQTPERWLALRAELDRRAAERLSLADIARRARCSVPHLCSEFKRWFGTSPIAYVIARRMRRAALLLRDRNRTVASVAAEVGCGDVRHFTRLFRAEHGRSPRRLRSELDGRSQ